MTGDNMDFLNAPEENLRTWEKVSKLMIVSAAVALAILALLGMIFV